MSSSAPPPPPATGGRVSERAGESKSQLAKISLLLLPMQIVLRGGDAILPLLTATWFGASGDTDFAIFAQFVSVMVGALLFQSFQDGSLVPILLQCKTESPEKLPRLRGAFLAYNALVGFALALLLMIVGIAAAALVGHGVMAAKMLPLFALQLFLLSLRTLHTTLLHVERKFFATPVIGFFGIVFNLGTMALTHHRLGVVAIALGLAVGEIAALSCAMVFVRLVYRQEIVVNLERSEPLRRFLKLVSAEVGGSAITRVNPLVDQFVAALVGVAGAGTLLKYSNDVATVPTSLVQATLLPVLVTHLAHLRHNGPGGSADLPEIEREVRRTLLWVVGLLSVAALVLWALRMPLLSLVFLRGKMDLAGVAAMADILPYHLLGLPSFGALLVLGRAHVSLQNSTILLRLGAVNAVTNVALNLLLVWPFGVAGVALATSLTHTVIAVIFFVLLGKKLRSLGPLETPS